MSAPSRQIADLTIHRIVELESPFMPALQMLPELTPEILAEHRGWLCHADALDDEDVFKLSSCGTATLCCTAHFPAPSAGRIVPWGDGFRCEPVQPGG